ncbi:hypothetical protein SIM91_02610 [Rhodococcus opacus]|uniref:hypothetical protein n=1 Tax=Rhodococcus opacus TaxID=37919 RepID=UPI000AF1170F|nr:hypothetical protein [Rhodococcus opacus]MDX5962233.1 hypothetical protein [Rhodococcus opacus]NKY74870.1 hypothetical protein [Rhodococcus opacus]CAG7642186.1 hypothetical protein E143388_08365 [Rhodococcus opacus]
MDMHRDDGIYTATCNYFRSNGMQGLPHGTSTTQHTSRAAAFEALNHALHAARADRASQVDVSLTRDDTAATQVIFAAGPRHIDAVHPELDEQRSAYSRAWEILTTHANEILSELRNPHSPVHQPLSPELHDVAWAARNVYDGDHLAVGGHDEPVDEPFGYVPATPADYYVQQHERFQAHLAGELDRAKGRARDAGHSEAQIEAATRTDPDLDMESLRQHSAALLHTVRNLAEDSTLTSQQRAALSAAVDQAEITVTQLNIHKGALSEDARAAAVTGVAAHNGIDTAVTRDLPGESEITPDQQFRQDVDTRAGELMQLLRQLRDDREVVVHGDVIGSDSYDLHNKIELEYGKLGESLAQDVLRRTPIDAAFEEHVHTRVEFEMRADRLHGQLFEYEQLHRMVFDGPGATERREQAIREVASEIDAHGQSARELRVSINTLDTSSNDEFFAGHVRNALRADTRVAQQASTPPAHVLDFPYPPRAPGAASAQTSLSNDDARNRPPRLRDTDLGR